MTIAQTADKGRNIQRPLRLHPGKKRITHAAQPHAHHRILHNPALPQRAAPHQTR